MLSCHITCMLPSNAYTKFIQLSEFEWRNLTTFTVIHQDPLRIPSIKVFCLELLIHQEDFFYCAVIFNECRRVWSPVVLNQIQLCKIDRSHSRHENTAVAFARTGVSVCEWKNSHSTWDLCDGEYMRSRRRERMYLFVRPSVRDHAGERLVIYFRVWIRMHLHTAVYVHNTPLPLPGSDGGVFLHRCYFSRPPLSSPKCFSAERFSKQSSLVPRALFTRALCHIEV